jgi:type II secretory pathway predicted ATPase ExeA
MYQDYFGLREAPFRITPDPAYFFPGAQRGAILDALGHAVREGHGIVKVVGEVGSGKTMLCRMLAARLGEQVDVVYLANPNLDPDEILTAIAQELGLAANAATGRQETLRLLNETLLERHAQGRRVVAFIEEAQGMPLTTLEEVRLLSNLETERDKLLQMILFGQPELDRHLVAPDIRQLRERITASFSLPPLNRAEVADYLRFRLAAAGWRGPDLFPAPLSSAIARASKGLTRRINILADKTLLAAFAEQSRELATRHVRAARADAEFASASSIGSTWGIGAARWPWLPWALGFVALAGIAFGLAPWRATNVREPVAPAPVRMAEAPRPILPSAPAAIEPRIETQPMTQAEPTPPAQVVPKAPPQPVAKAAVPKPPAAAPAPPLAPAAKPAPPVAQPAPAPAPPPAFAIQLLAGGRDEAERLAQAARDLNLNDELQLMQTDEGGKTVWKLMLGHYANRELAVQAMAALPETLARHRPFIRDISGIPAETN